MLLIATWFQRKRKWVMNRKLQLIWLQMLLIATDLIANDLFAHDLFWKTEEVFIFTWFRWLNGGCLGRSNGRWRWIGSKSKRIHDVWQQWRRWSHGLWYCAAISSFRLHSKLSDSWRISVPVSDWRRFTVHWWISAANSNQSLELTTLLFRNYFRVTQSATISLKRSSQ